jgi:hypothetical protein
MFGSQALETAIGLAVMFFVLATAASVVTESISRMFRKRAKDLKRCVLEMLTKPAPDDRETRRAAQTTRLAEAKPFFDMFKATSIWQAAEAASGRTLLLRRKVGNSYLSARSFADAVHEALTAPTDPTDSAKETTVADLKAMLETVPSLKKRLTVLTTEAKRGMLEVKAGLETWFDETMGRAEGAYKRWAAVVLFLVGLFLAVAGNASTTDVARDLWQNSATRNAVAEAATNVGDEPGDIQSVADATEQLSALHLPVGWDVAGTDDAKPDNPVDFFADSTAEVVIVTILGWLLTALLVMLGGPFWFDLLTRLVALRSSGKKPLPATEDEASATKIATAAAIRAPDQTADSPELNRLRELLGVETGAGSTAPPPPPPGGPPPTPSSGSPPPLPAPTTPAT